MMGRAPVLIKIRSACTCVSVPSSAVFDLFASYRTKIGTTPVSVQASVYNVFNRSYWILQPGQGSKLLLSMPRTFMLSATFDI